ncbi:NmrA family NAD(P)-binding protein [Bdellovibrio sp. HCB288]|uniref:NmrA family NAD(P)-binding protein n=1 Tax=Bdellovibrio sp. HCB288 TaxID=3394355 RepID=UPI0039B6A669
MKERILITGATGKMGRELVRRLDGRQARFVAASHDASVFDPEVRHRQVDLGVRSLVEEVMKETDILFLNLPISESMLVYAQNAIIAAKNSAVRFVVFNSILGADADSQFLLHRMYGQIEEMVRDSRLPLAVIRPNHFMQSFVSRHADSIRQGALFLPEGESKSSYVDVRDVVDVALKVVENPWLYENRVINLTGPEALSLEEILGKVSKVAGYQVRYVPVTEEAAKHGLLRDGHSVWMAEAFLSTHRAAREGMTAWIHPCNHEVRGVAPRNFDGFCSEMGTSLFHPYSLRQASL